MNDRNVGGGLYKSGCVLEKIKAANENFISKLQTLSGTSNNSNDEEVEITNDYFVLNGDIDQQEELEVYGGGGSGVISPPVAQTEMVNDTKGLNISWGNYRGGIILMTQTYFHSRL